MTTDKLIARIEHEIEINGGNKHQYPLSFGKSKGEWDVVIEVNNSKGTFDIQTAGPTLVHALNEALTALRRMYSKPRR